MNTESAAPCFTSLPRRGGNGDSAPNLLTGAMLRLKWSRRQRRPWEDSLAMPRRPRRTCWTDAACYHVMNRGQNRATIFADDNDRVWSKNSDEGSEPWKPVGRRWDGLGWWAKE